MSTAGTQRDDRPDKGRVFRKTCRRYSEPGHAHALTFSCFARRPFLNRDRSRLWLLDSLAAARTKHNFALWAYVLMPEHVHLVIFPRDDVYSISRILGDIKQPVTRVAVKYVREHAPSFLRYMRDVLPDGKVTNRFWQRGGGYDRNLSEPGTVFKTIDYIHANPVRRGLVESPSDWPWSSAGYYVGQSDVPIIPDDDNMPPRDGVW